jgi:hypothetical protein
VIWACETAEPVRLERRLQRVLRKTASMATSA